MLTSNPVSAVKSVQGENDEDVLNVVVRLPFSMKMQAEIMRRTGQKPRNSADFWWPRINLRQGLRLQEFTQLSVFDFRMLHGRMCLDLLHFDFDGDPRHRSRRKELKLKSNAALRIMPLAQEVLDSGFLDFIERRRRLFCRCCG
ncbi:MULTISPECIES: hypothetical protein [unclassified Devosia]|uniref:hypothetical protein n=1 Tax=unclassified Devosia TaxID=196773 RepID=UPI001557AF23|nr:MULTISPECIES: hypothetical protein [unclassified Devosia]